MPAAEDTMDTIFLSTLSVRRATNLGGYKTMTIGHFYPRSP